MALLVTEYSRDCEAYPSSWTLTTANGARWYVRYRWGQLTIRRYDFGGRLMENPIFSVALGGPDDGVMSDEYMKCVVAAFFEFREASAV